MAEMNASDEPDSKRQKLENDIVGAQIEMEIHVEEVLVAPVEEEVVVAVPRRQYAFQRHENLNPLQYWTAIFTGKAKDTIHGIQCQLCRNCHPLDFWRIHRCEICNQCFNNDAELRNHLHKRRNYFEEDENDDEEEV
jgi:hypothetical protein